MASRSDTELLTEHFGYPPVSLLDQIINTLNALAERALSSIESGLLNAPPAALGFRPPKYPAPDAPEYDAATAHRQEVESGVHALETLLFASIDRDFDLFEIVVMRNVLTVSAGDIDWVTLQHYRDLDFGGDGDESESGSVESTTTGPVNDLRRRLQASLKLRVMLEAEKARNRGLLREMKRLVGSDVKEEEEDTTEETAEEEGEGHEEGKRQGKAFGFLLGDLGLSGDKQTPVSTTAAFGVSQLEGLRQLSEDLRGVMKELGKDENDDQDGDEEKDKKKDWRRERLEYIEGATRRHLQQVRGLELGENGEVRGEEDEAMVGVGKGRMNGKDVENLERVVGLLGVGVKGGGDGQVDEDRMDES